MTDQPRPQNSHAYLYGILHGIFGRSTQALIGTATVLPLFIGTLTDKKWLIGLGSSLEMGGWFLPQIIGAYFIARRAYRIPWYRMMGMIRITAVASIAILTWTLGGSHPAILLPLFLVLEATYAISGGLAGVAFLDIIGKEIPTRAHRGSKGRGSFFGWRIFVGGAAGIVSGFFIVQPVLEHFAYPANFALLFALATLTVIGGVVLFGSVRENPSQRELENGSFGEHFLSCVNLITTDAAYRRYFIVRHLNMLWTMGLPFFIIYAEEQYVLSSFWIGAFLASRFAGEMSFNFMWAKLSDRGHNRLVLRATTMFSLIPPALVLLHSIVHYTEPFFALVFFLTGGRMSGNMVGGNNYLLQHAPAQDRPKYIGFTNSTLGLTMFSAGLGGLLADYIGFRALFIVMETIAIVSFLAAVTMLPARKLQSMDNYVAR